MNQHYEPQLKQEIIRLIWKRAGR